MAFRIDQTVQSFFLCCGELVGDVGDVVVSERQQDVTESVDYTVFVQVRDNAGAVETLRHGRICLRSRYFMSVVPLPAASVQYSDNREYAFN